MADNPIAMAGMAGVAGSSSVASGNGSGASTVGNVGAGSGATKMAGPVSGPGSPALGDLDQIRSVLEAAVPIMGRPNLVITRDADGTPLWVDILAAIQGGGAAIPGHTTSVQFGAPPEGAFTNPAAFFAQSVVTSAPLGVPLWVWGAGIAAFFFFVWPMLRGRR